MRPYDQGYLDGVVDAEEHVADDEYRTPYTADELVSMGEPISYIHGYEAGVASIYELA